MGDVLLVFGRGDEGWGWDRIEVGGGVGRGDKGGERGGFEFAGLGVDTRADEGAYEVTCCEIGGGCITRAGFSVERAVEDKDLEGDEGGRESVANAAKDEAGNYTII